MLGHDGGKIHRDCSIKHDHLDTISPPTGEASKFITNVFGIGEMRVSILTYLSTEYLTQMTRVNKTWHIGIDDSLAFKHLMFLRPIAASLVPHDTMIFHPSHDLSFKMKPRMTPNIEPVFSRGYFVEAEKWPKNEPGCRLRLAGWHVQNKRQASDRSRPHHLRVCCHQ